MPLQAFWLFRRREAATPAEGRVQSGRHPRGRRLAPLPMWRVMHTGQVGDDTAWLAAALAPWRYIRGYREPAPIRPSPARLVGVAKHCLPVIAARPWFIQKA